MNLLICAADEQESYLPLISTEAKEGELRYPFVEGYYFKGSTIQYAIIDATTRSPGYDSIYTIKGLSIKNEKDLLIIISMLLESSKSSMKLYKLLTRIQIIDLTEDESSEGSSKSKEEDSPEDESSEGSSKSEDEDFKKKGASKDSDNKDGDDSSSSTSNAPGGKGSIQTQVRTNGGSIPTKEASVLKDYSNYDYRIVEIIHKTSRSVCTLMLSTPFDKKCFGKFYHSSPTVDEKELLALKLSCVPQSFVMMSRDVTNDYQKQPPYCLFIESPIDLYFEHFVLAEWIDGLDLTQLPDDLDFTHYVRGLFVAVNMLHENGFLHRDIKPENTLYDRTRGQVFLCDTEHVIHFTVGASISDKLLIGTRGYMAPEIEKRREYSASSDFYAVGKTVQSLQKFSDHPIFNSVLGLITPKIEDRASPVDIFKIIAAS